MPATKGPAKARYQTEEALHRAVATFLHLALSDVECLHFHVPNGEKRSKAAAGKLKGMGVRAGVPDFCFVLPGGRAGSQAGGRLSPAQLCFKASCEAIGAHWAVCSSLEHVETMLIEWNVPLLARLNGNAIERTPRGP